MEVLTEMKEVQPIPVNELQNLATERNKQPNATTPTKIAKPTNAKTPPNYQAGSNIEPNNASDFTSKSNTSPNEKPKITRVQKYIGDNYELRYDVVSNDVEWRSLKVDEPPGDFESINESTLTVKLFENCFTGFSDMLKALLRSSWVPTVDPIRAYFESLPVWTPDKPDYIAQLASYVKPADIDWFLLQYRKMLVRTVACGIGEIPFNKQCFVLVGKQNDGKSTFLRFHCPRVLENYYTEQIDFENKDGLIALASNLFINLDELANFNKADINKCKAFFTTDKIKIRHPFDPKPKITKRRASFFGSTNETSFLTDATGNVRWLIMEVREIRHDNGGINGYAQNVDIDNVWSQAYTLLKSGFNFNMTKEDIELSERHNKQHLRVTDEMDYAQKHLKLAEPKANGAEFVTSGDIVRWLQEHYGNRLKINSVNMGKALSALGFSLIPGRSKNYIHPIQGYWVIYSTKSHFSDFVEET